MISSISPDWSSEKTARGKTLCAAFLNAPKHQRFLLGRNVYAKAVADHISVAGVIDDFTKETIWAGLPIVKLTDVPDEAIVLACSGGRPLTVRRLLNQKGVTHLDYFTFLKFSGLTLPQAVFNEDFAEIATNHQAALEWLDHLMADKISRTTLRQLISFRMSYDLAALEGFTQREDVQYFEPFIDFAAGTPVFVDVGGYDGFTAKEFIRHAPTYKSVHVFEPDAANQSVCQATLQQFDNIFLHPYGAGSHDAILRFSADGSTSAISANGTTEIQVRRIDDLVHDAPTFIKMDIEGAELAALEGARGLICKHKPALAICVYHRPTDFWDVPRKVLSMYDGYSVYLRHYTESIYETVMFFVPAHMKNR